MALASATIPGGVHGGFDVEGGDGRVGKWVGVAGFEELTVARAGLASPDDLEFRFDLLVVEP